MYLKSHKKDYLGSLYTHPLFGRQEGMAVVKGDESLFFSEMLKYSLYDYDSVATRKS